MRRARVAGATACLLLAALPSGCGSVGRGSVDVSGGTAVQRALVRGIVHDLGSSRAFRVRLRPPEGGAGMPQGGVEMQTEVRPATDRGEWEAKVVASAFQERSLVAHLPGVTVSKGGGEMTPLVGPGPPLKVRLPAPGGSEAWLRKKIQRAAKAAHVSVVSEQVTRPYGLAAAVVVYTDRPGHFLLHENFAGRSGLWGIRASYVEVRDWLGPAAVEWSVHFPRLVATSAWARPDLQNCLVVPRPLLPRPFGAEATPCPE